MTFKGKSASICCVLRKLVIYLVNYQYVIDANQACHANIEAYKPIYFSYKTDFKNNVLFILFSCAGNKDLLHLFYGTSVLFLQQENTK